MLDRRRAIAVAGATLSAILGYAWFASRPEMAVLVGTEPLAKTVPAHYQACVFPALGALLATLAFDVLRGELGWRGRALLVVVSSGLATLRLLSLIPVSGHALFASALIAHELVVRRAERTPFALALAALGLAVTSWYKLAVWGDLGWFSASVGIGAVLGAGTAKVH